jgi:hypothetical protein
VRDPFLGLRLGCSSGLCRKLKHCCFLTFEHVREEHDLPVRKFQCIMMCLRVVLVDLPEDGRRVIDCRTGPDGRSRSVEEITRRYVQLNPGEPSHTPMHVRFAPKATVGDQSAIRRFVPIAS